MLPVIKSLANSFSSLAADTKVFLDENKAGIAQWSAGLTKGATAVRLAFTEMPLIFELVSEKFTEFGKQFGEVLPRFAAPVAPRLGTIFGGLGSFLGDLFYQIGEQAAINLAKGIANNVTTGPQLLALKTLFPLLGTTIEDLNTRQAQPIVPKFDLLKAAPVLDFEALFADLKPNPNVAPLQARLDAALAKNQALADARGFFRSEEVTEAGKLLAGGFLGAVEGRSGALGGALGQAAGLALGKLKVPEGLGRAAGVLAGGLLGGAAGCAGRRAARTTRHPGRGPRPHRGRAGGGEEGGGRLLGLAKLLQEFAGRRPGRPRDRAAATGCSAATTRRLHRRTGAVGQDRPADECGQ